MSKVLRSDMAGWIAIVIFVGLGIGAYSYSTAVKNRRPISVQSTETKSIQVASIAGGGEVTAEQLAYGASGNKETASSKTSAAEEVLNNIEVVEAGLATYYGADPAVDVRVAPGSDAYPVIRIRNHNTKPVKIQLAIEPANILVLKDPVFQNGYTVSIEDEKRKTPYKRALQGFRQMTGAGIPIYAGNDTTINPAGDSHYTDEDGVWDGSIPEDPAVGPSLMGMVLMWNRLMVNPSLLRGSDATLRLYIVNNGVKREVKQVQLHLLIQ